MELIWLNRAWKHIMVILGYILATKFFWVKTHFTSPTDWKIMLNLSMLKSIHKKRLNISNVEIRLYSTNYHVVMAWDSSLRFSLFRSHHGKENHCVIPEYIEVRIRKYGGKRRLACQSWFSKRLPVVVSVNHSLFVQIWRLQRVIWSFSLELPLKISSSNSDYSVWQPMVWYIEVFYYWAHRVLELTAEGWLYLSFDSNILVTWTWL